jgi:uncharacterized surface protein with fasciclin (FAS1) repeats
MAMRTRHLAGVLAATALLVSACGGDDEPAAPDPAPEAASTPDAAPATPGAGGGAEAAGTPATTPDPGATSGTFGPRCADLPASGEGSLEEMADQLVGSAVAGNPLLSTLVTAVGAAGLRERLDEAEDVTVFVPTDEAFAAVDRTLLARALGDPRGLLTTVLTYHVVDGRLSPAELAGTHQTLAGEELTVEGSGEDFTVGGEAAVVCGNVQTANATVYFLDSVLLPPSVR